MSTTTQCFRHPRGTWIASCTDCTAWHLADAIARRDRAASAVVTRFPITPRRPLGRFERVERTAA